MNNKLMGININSQNDFPLAYFPIVSIWFAGFALISVVIAAYVVASDPLFHLQITIPALLTTTIVAALNTREFIYRLYKPGLVPMVCIGSKITAQSVLLTLMYISWTFFSIEGLPLIFFGFIAGSIFSQPLGILAALLFRLFFKTKVGVYDTN